MLEIQEAIVVEGRYDKNAILQVVKAPVFVSDGFHVMKDKALLQLLRNVAEKRGLIIFTDSDGAGFIIRNFLKSAISTEYLKHAYIPDVYGKEHRKSSPGKEGKLGVEGMTPDVIKESILRAGATVLNEDRETEQKKDPITKLDLFELHLTGWPDSELRRNMLKKVLGLPEHLSTNGLLQAINAMFTREEFLGE